MTALIILGAIAAMAGGTWLAMRLAKAHNPPAPVLSLRARAVVFYDAPAWFTETMAWTAVTAAIDAWPESPWSLWGAGEPVPRGIRGAFTFHAKQNWSGSPGQTQGNASKVCVTGVDQASALNMVRHEICHQALDALGITGEDAHREIHEKFGRSA